MPLDVEKSQSSFATLLVDIVPITGKAAQRLVYCILGLPVEMEPPMLHLVTTPAVAHISPEEHGITWPLKNRDDHRPTHLEIHLRSRFERHQQRPRDNHSQRFLAYLFSQPCDCIWVEVAVQHLSCILGGWHGLQCCTPCFVNLKGLTKGFGSLPQLCQQSCACRVRVRVRVSTQFIEGGVKGGVEGAPGGKS